MEQQSINIIYETNMEPLLHEKHPHEHKHHPHGHKRKGKLPLGVKLSLLALLAGLSITEIVFAISWHHWIGMVFGFFGGLLSLIGVLFVFDLFPLPRGEHRKGKFRTIFAIVSSILGSLIFILLLIHLLAPDPNLTTFPKGCKKSTNCSRLTTNSTSNVRIHNLIAPIEKTDPESISNSVVQFIDSQPGGALLYKTSDLLHARFVSNWWGFPDDLYVQLLCTSNHSVAVWIQGEARLGTSDFQVNYDRVSELVFKLDGDSFPSGQCE